MSGEINMKESIWIFWRFRGGNYKTFFLGYVKEINDPLVKIVDTSLSYSGRWLKISEIEWHEKK